MKYKLREQAIKKKKKTKTIQIVEKNQDCLLRAMRNQGFQQDSDKI